MKQRTYSVSDICLMTEFSQTEIGALNKLRMNYELKE